MRRIAKLSCTASITCIGFVTTVALAQVQAVSGHREERRARWYEGVITLSVDASLEQIHPRAIESVARAADAWRTVDAELPTLLVVRGQALPVGYQADGPNQNDVRFVADGDSAAGRAVATTTLSYNVENELILDADITLNGRYPFAVMDPERPNLDAYDLQSVLTHEIGHLLGLNENRHDAAATMYARSSLGVTNQRSPNISDRDAVHGLYAPAAVGCGGANLSGHTAAAGSAWWLFASVGLAVLGRRGRERRQQPRVSIHLPLEVRAGGHEVIQAQTANISMGGMLIESRALPAVGTEVRIKATLPDSTELVVPATVRWGTAEGFGVQFGLLGARETHAIAQLMRGRREE